MAHHYEVAPTAHTTEENARKGHIALWDWMSDNYGVVKDGAPHYPDKSDWPGWKENGGEYSDENFGVECLACEVACIRAGRCYNICGYCPCTWSNRYGDVLEDCCYEPYQDFHDQEEYIVEAASWEPISNVVGDVINKGSCYYLTEEQWVYLCRTVRDSWPEAVADD